MSPTSTLKKKRSLWPIAITSFFVIAIVSIAGFIAFAVRQNTDLIKKDYYADELQFQNHLDQINRTQQLKFKPAIAYDRTRDLVTISMWHPQSAIEGHVQFYRPSDAALDKNIKLTLNGNGAQEIDARTFPGGHWKVRLTWKVNGEEFYIDETIFIEKTRS